MPTRVKDLQPELRGFPERLKTAREEAGKGMRELGEESGMDGGRISRYEKRQRFEGVTADVIISLAKALNVRPGWLLSGELPMRADGSFILIENTPQLAEALRQAIREVPGVGTGQRKARG